MKSMWTSMRTCQWVEPNEDATGELAGVMFYRNQNGIGLPPAKVREEEAKVGSRNAVLAAN